MTESAIRFGVKEPQGFRAATWKCWTLIGGGKFDVYLSCRELKGELKASFHESGSWHIAFTKKLVSEGFEDPSNQPKSRYTDIWPRPKAIAPGILLAFQILVPWSSPNVTDGANDPKVVWISCATPGNAIEVSILFTGKGVVVSGWPGRSLMGTALIGFLDLENGEKVWLVYRSIPFVPPSLAPARIQYLKGCDLNDIQSQNLSAIIFGDREDGIRVMIDASIRWKPDGST